MSQAHGPKRDAVIQLRLTQPELTLKEIGEKVSLTRERVRQLLKKAGMETRSAKEAYQRRPEHLRFGDPCRRCGEPVPWTRNKHYKATNGRYYSTGSYALYCSKECRSAPQIVLICEYCGNEYKIASKLYARRLKFIAEGKYKSTYCSYSCKSLAYWSATKGHSDNPHNYRSRPPGHPLQQPELTCYSCGIVKSIARSDYNQRVKKSLNSHGEIKLYCSTKCSKLLKTKIMTTISCSYCGKSTSMPLSIYKARQKVSKSKNIYCNRVCFNNYWKDKEGWMSTKKKEG